MATELSLYQLNQLKLDATKEAVDKLKIDAATINGLTVQTSVPLNAKFTDTIYSHPGTHPASIIEQNSNNRFVTDTQIQKWNNSAKLGHTHTKNEVGLGNVDNTSDINKPISTLTQNALTQKVNKSGDTITGELIVNNKIKAHELDLNGAVIKFNSITNSIDFIFN